jgi:hypothetical protein
MLVKLKTECGYQFTSKLESMFTDIKTSRDMMQEFKKQLTGKGEQLPLDLSVQVRWRLVGFLLVCDGSVLLPAAAVVRVCVRLLDMS